MYKLVVGTLVVLLASLMIITLKKQNSEQFEQINVPPPNWFFKQTYNPVDWLVQSYPERIQPSCLSYSIDDKYGSRANFNYLSSSNRFWRM